MSYVRCVHLVLRTDELERIRSKNFKLVEEYMVITALVDTYNFEYLVLILNTLTRSSEQLALYTSHFILFSHSAIGGSGKKSISIHGQVIQEILYCIRTVVKREQNWLN